MAITVIDKSYANVTGRSLINNTLLKSFNILKDDTTKFLNIFRSSKIFDLDIRYFLLHELGDNDWWDNLSQQYYATPYLWWTIPLINKIENPFEMPDAGTNIKVLRKDYIYNLLEETKEIAN